MKRHALLVWALVLFWLLVAVGYFYSAWQQKTCLNLSATAGGQMPYLVYARHVAEAGLTGHFGDRNRMPLIPVLTSVVHDRDWDVFVDRAAWLAIITSMVILLGIGAVAYSSLSIGSATAFTLIVAVTVFLQQASFVQADLAYYGLFFCSWWMMCRLVRAPNWRRAVIVGLLLGATYLTKASALLALAVLLVVLIVQAAAHRQRRGAVTAAMIVMLSFVVVVFPYLHNNRQHFGRYFYNVNTTFFMWCDSWAQAQWFAADNAIDRQYPSAPLAAIPGPMNYWKTHSLGQIGMRLTYGLKTLGNLLINGPYFKYIAILAAASLMFVATCRARAKGIGREYWWPIFFTVLLLGAYAIAYAWYVLVAYGDRFVVSLLLPAMFGAFWFGEKLSCDTLMLRLFGRQMRADRLLAVLLILLATGEGAVAAVGSWNRPAASFVRFYYDESREEQLRGNFEEAERGYRGVIQLDPEFAAAHRDLGMIALTRERFDDAIVSLSHAAHLQPEWADVHNSLGSALIQARRPAEAISALERATILDPNLAVAWYNLGGAYCLLGELDRARTIRVRLQLLSPKLAEHLEELITSSLNGPSENE